MAICVSVSVILCAGHNQRQGGVLCQAEPKKLDQTLANWNMRAT